VPAKTLLPLKVNATEIARSIATFDIAFIAVSLICGPLFFLSFPNLQRWLRGARCVDPLMPVSLPAGIVLAEQDHGTAVAGIGFVWIADTNGLDRFYRTRLTGGRAQSCRRVGIAHSTMYSCTGWRRSLPSFRYRFDAIKPGVSTLFKASFVTVSTITIATLTDSMAGDIVQSSKTFCRQ
jgi:hypothetical protein